MSQEIKEKQDDNTSSSNWSIKKKIMNILQMISKSEDNIETTAVTVPLYDSNRKPWEVYDKLS